MLPHRRALVLATTTTATSAQTGYRQDALCVSGQATLCPELPTALEGATTHRGDTPTTDAQDNPGNPGNPNNAQPPYLGKVIWEETPPYAKRYLGAGRYGT